MKLIVSTVKLIVSTMKLIVEVRADGLGLVRGRSAATDEASTMVSKIRSASAFRNRKTYGALARFLA